MQSNHIFKDNNFLNDYPMALTLENLRFVAKPILYEGQRPRELAFTMRPHPLSYMELPYDPEYTLYNSRLTPEKLDTVTDDEMYWAVRRLEPAKPHLSPCR